MKIFLATCLLLASATSFSAKPADEEFSYGISIAHLVAHPERFDGRTVILEGYLKISGSYSSLFVSREDLKDGLMFNSIGIVNGGNEKFLRVETEGKAVQVEGVFEANPPAPGLDHPTSGQLIRLRSLSPMPKLAQ